MFVRPLADRLRPESFDDIAGQPHLFSANGSLRRMLDGGEHHSQAGGDDDV